ncbi:hypothetical protein Fot_37408 [Forsythia ovata]|uniref:Uncharacterized protein n=1 Tax=Forsythia ovata TaxID=205694 RepID=A0ABD1RZM3_9LAMI
MARTKTTNQHPEVKRIRRSNTAASTSPATHFSRLWPPVRCTPSLATSTSSSNPPIPQLFHMLYALKPQLRERVMRVRARTTEQSPNLAANLKKPLGESQHTEQIE